MPDPAVDPELTITKWFAGVIFTGLAALVGIIYNKHEKDFEKIERRVEEMEKCKADKADTDKRLDRGSDKFDEMLALLRDVKDAQTAMDSRLLAELSSRPTREEVRVMLQQSSRG